ncbi:MAG: hypothetical protein EP297_14695, partial [Gammaproteobacteria bacterium]
MFSTLRQAFKEGDMHLMDSVQKMDDQVDILHDEILEYLSDIRQEPLTDHQSEVFRTLMGAAINLENLADVIETELVAIGKAFIDQQEKPTEAATMILLEDFADKVGQAIADVIKAVSESSEKAAENVIAVKDEIRRISDEFLTQQSESMGMKEADSLQLIRLQMELLDKLRQIYTLAKRVAKDFVPLEVASKA